MKTDKLTKEIPGLRCGLTCKQCQHNGTRQSTVLAHCLLYDAHLAVGYICDVFEPRRQDEDEN
jgi:hypothetical protein